MKTLWKHVSDVEPPLDEDVLVWSPGYGHSVARLCETCGDDPEVRLWFDEHDLVLEGFAEPTHWMELPNPPR